MAEDVSENLSGLWNGQYDYPLLRPPVPFAAALLQNGECLSGSITEKSDLWRRQGQTLYATVQGRRAGSAVTFVKVYEVPDPDYHDVAYAGVLSGDGREIEGRWTTGGWSGRFLMIRASTRKAAVPARVSETV